MQIIKYLAAACLAVLLPAAHAEFGDGDAVFMYAEVGNGEGGYEGLGYHFDQSVTLTKPAQMRNGAGLRFGDVGTQVKVRVSAGQFTRLSAEADTWSSGPIALSRCYSEDTVVAGAPGVEPGEPILYMAKLKISATTTLSSPGGPYHTAQFSGGLFLGDGWSWGLALSGNQSKERILVVHYLARAGEKMSIGGSLQAYAHAANLAAPVASAVATARLDKPARIVLYADKPGANVTGRSGHVYQ